MFLRRFPPALLAASLAVPILAVTAPAAGQKKTFTVNADFDAGAFNNSVDTNYAPNGWSNANMQKLVTNAVGWVARCQ